MARRRWSRVAQRRLFRRSSEQRRLPWRRCRPGGDSAHDHAAVPVQGAMGRDGLAPRDTSVTPPATRRRDLEGAHGQSRSSVRRSVPTMRHDQTSLTHTVRFLGVGFSVMSVAAAGSVRRMNAAVDRSSCAGGPGLLTGPLPGGARSGLRELPRPPLGQGHGRRRSALGDEPVPKPGLGGTSSAASSRARRPGRRCGCAFQVDACRPAPQVTATDPCRPGQAADVLGLTA